MTCTNDVYASDGGEVEIVSVAPAKELLKRLHLEKEVGDKLTAAMGGTNIHELLGAIQQVPTPHFL